VTAPNQIRRPRARAHAACRAPAAIILGGGAGTRLYPLTKQRAKPAVPIGGAYRLIDVPMSNCINSGISKIYILTQFNSTSLNRHLARTYNMGSGVRFGGDGFVEVLAATQVRLPPRRRAAPARAAVSCGLGAASRRCQPLVGMGAEILGFPAASGGWVVLWQNCCGRAAVGSSPAVAGGVRRCAARGRAFRCPSGAAASAAPRRATPRRTRRGARANVASSGWRGGARASALPTVWPGSVP
jgi:hypothetical protein